MKQRAWMIYGATGCLGRLLTRSAVARGLRPVLAGRNANSLERTAKEFQLPWCSFTVEDKTTCRRQLKDVDLVVNTAGPFRHTAVLLAESCLAAGAHYFDVSREVPQSVALHTLDAEAKRKQLTVMPGLGFSASASSCLAKHLYGLMPNADCLEIALEPFSRVHTNGQNLTMLDGIASGGFRRREGKLQRYWLGSACKRARLPTGIRTLVPVPLGDAEAAYHSTGIPNITAHIAIDAPPYTIGVSLSLGQAMLSLPFMHSLFRSRISAQCVDSEPEDVALEGRSLVWARVIQKSAPKIEGWLWLEEEYNVTAAAVIAGVLEFFKKNSLPSGFQTPATALGEDFILALPGVERTVKTMTPAS